MKSIEELVREVLQQAVRDDLVQEVGFITDLSTVSSGELTGCAEVVTKWLKEGGPAAVGQPPAHERG